MPSIQLVTALASTLPTLDIPQQAVPENTICAMTGIPLTEGVSLSAILASATADIATQFTFYGASSFVHPDVATAFKTRLAGNMLIIQDGDSWCMERPLVNRESALKDDRPCWSERVRSLVYGTQTIAIFCDDVQRRIWPNAAISTVGDTWRVYLHDETGSRVVTVNHSKLTHCLDVVERVYTQGFGRDAMRSGLISLSQQKKIVTLGIEHVYELEQQLDGWRNTAEFDVALYCAQKEKQA